MLTQLEHPAPGSRETVTSQVGLEMIRDRVPVGELRQNVYELEERASQPFVVQCAGEHCALYAARTKESGLRPRGGLVKSTSDFENAGLQ